MSDSERAHKAHGRRGYVLVASVAAVAIVIGILLPLVPAALRNRRQVEMDRSRLQGEFLCAGSLRLALAALVESDAPADISVEVDVPSMPDYAGRSEIHFHDTDSGNVRLEIVVTLVPSGEFTFPTSHSRHVRIEREWEFAPSDLETLRASIAKSTE